MANTTQVVELLASYPKGKEPISLDGNSLTIAQLVAASEKKATFQTTKDAENSVDVNAQFLNKTLRGGTMIYGINTGYGGSADVRSGDLLEVQRALLHHLNAGFGDTLEPSLIRAVMVARANSLSKGYSGVRPEVIHCLLHMVNEDIVPVVPKRGSISASGDLMPNSYIASCMMGRPDAKVLYKGTPMTMSEVIERKGMSPIVFQGKEALAVVNAASCAYSMGACNLYDASLAVLMTQVATAMSVESLRGRVESFHPTLQNCMPHPGQKEAAANIKKLLRGSKLAVQHLDFKLEDREGLLKQDRYALRSAPQWMAPVIETLTKSISTITIDINSANDNPILDHRKQEILHGANFQGVATTVAMDQARQAIQMCGKLLFAQMSEMLNVKMSNNLPPNLCGSDPNIDFGLKGTDTAMASYCSELDYLTGPLTNHVLSAEMHNQSVNSMGLVSARMTQQALEILQMMLANITLSHVQAIDLRWLQSQVEKELAIILDKFDIKSKYVSPQIFPWYKFAFLPQETGAALMDFVEVNSQKKMDFMDELEKVMTSLKMALENGEKTKEVAATMAKETRKMYLFVREELKVPFANGKPGRYVDNMLSTIFTAFKQRDHLQMVLSMFE